MLFFKNICTLVLSFVVTLSVSNAFAAGQKKVTVYTSILPQRYFVEKIAGDRIDVQVLVGPGKNPATYEPTPQQVMGLGNAAVLFTIGVPFEKAFVPTISSTLPALKISDTSAGIEKRTFTTVHTHEETEEAFGHERDHTEGAKDPHIWMSPRLAKLQSKTIYDTLVEIDPQGKAVYQQGYRSLIKELNAIDVQLSDVLAPFKGKTMFVFHPAFGYFADAYQLKQVAIETGGKEPTPSVLADIIGHAKEDNVHIIFVQPEFSQNAARAIAQSIKGAVVTISPLNPDYINNLTYIATELEKGFKQK
jgi:zinc transport system substrate-binding protein